MPRYQTDPQGRRQEPGDAGYQWDQPSMGYDPVTDAKAFLDDPKTSQWSEPSPEALANATQGTSVPRESMSLRGLTDIMESAALPVAGMGLIPSPASPALLGASGILSGAGGLRKMLAPEEDESRAGGALQAGLSALPGAGSAMRGIRGMTQLPMKRFPISAEKAYRGAESMENFSGLNQQPQSIAALEKLVAGRNAGPAVPTETLNQLPESWRQFASMTSPKVAKSPAKVVHTPDSRLAKMNRESEAGYRNVPPESNNPMLDSLPEGGLGSITPTEWSKLGLRQVREDIPAYLDEAADWGPELFEQLAQRTSRQGIPARARAFHNNTPFTE